MGVSVAADLTAGTFAGATSLVVGHPFDTIKVKLQSQPRPLPGQPPQFTGALDAVKKTISEGGMTSLFRGMGAPFATVAVYNAVLFAARGQMESILAHADGSPLSVADQAIAGAGAGCAGALLACPTELIKCRLQAQANMQSKGTGVLTHPGVTPIGLATLSQSGKGLATLVQAAAPSPALSRQSQAGAALMQGFAGQPGAVGRQQAAAGLAGLSQSGKGLAALVQAGGPAKGFSTLHMGAAATSGTTPGALHLGEITGSLQYRGPVDVMRQVMKGEGGPVGLYKGLLPTMVREVAGCSAMFAAYEAIKLGVVKQQGLRSASELGKGPLMLAGGAAGAVYWLCVYPADIIKSKLQTDNFRKPAYRGSLDCARQLYAADGMAAFFKGFSPAFTRSIPANALAFLVYEEIRQAMTKDA